MSQVLPDDRDARQARQGLPAAAALALAALADAVTFAHLPPGAELNPIAATWPVAAICAKALLVVLILGLPLGDYARRVRLFGAFAWSVGALSNLIVLL